MQSENIILESFEKFKKIYSKLNFSNIATKYKFEKQWTCCENNLLIFITQNNPSELEKLFSEIFGEEILITDIKKKIYIYLCVAEILNKKFQNFEIFEHRKDTILKLYRDMNENMSRFMSILNEELQNIFIEWINSNVTKEEIEQRIILGTPPKINNKELIIQKPKPQQKTQIQHQPQKPQVRELKINQTQGTSVRTLEMLNNIFNRK